MSLTTKLKEIFRISSILSDSPVSKVKLMSMFGLICSQTTDSLYQTNSVNHDNRTSLQCICYRMVDEIKVKNKMYTSVTDMTYTSRINV